MMNRHVHNYGKSGTQEKGASDDVFHSSAREMFLLQRWDAWSLSLSQAPLLEKNFFLPLRAFSSILSKELSFLICWRPRRTTPSQQEASLFVSLHAFVCMYFVRSVSVYMRQRTYVDLYGYTLTRDELHRSALGVFILAAYPSFANFFFFSDWIFLGKTERGRMGLTRNSTEVSFVDLRV